MNKYRWHLRNRHQAKCNSPQTSRSPSTAIKALVSCHDNQYSCGKIFLYLNFHWSHPGLERKSCIVIQTRDSDKNSNLLPFYIGNRIASPNTLSEIVFFPKIDISHKLGCVFTMVILSKFCMGSKESLLRKQRPSGRRYPLYDLVPSNFTDAG